MTSKDWVALAALFLFLTGAASAAYTIDLDPSVPVVNNGLTVTVKNDGNPASGVLVRFVLNGGTPISTTTDSQGNAKFIPPATGTLDIYASTMEGVALASKKQVSVAAEGATPVTTAAPGSSGSSGGSAGASEPFSNIEKSEQYDKDLIANAQVTYNFASPELGIYEIVVTGDVNEYDISVKVEALKGTSKLAASPPPGIVYKNTNILAGTKKIKNVLIRFKVKNTWLTDSNVASSDIRLVKYDGSKWIILETSEKKKDLEFTQYEAKTDSLSLFAITGIKTPASAAAPPAAAATAPKQEETKATSTPAGSVPGFEAIIAMAAISALYMLWRKRR